MPLLQFAFLFMIGSVLGWLIEVVFRKFFSDANPEKKWINPGFCTGPYLPLYGFGLCFLYAIACFGSSLPIGSLVWKKIFLILTMTVCMTVTEYIAGVLALKIMKVRLWDYRSERGNLQGIICPRFTALWALLAALYDLLLHPVMEKAVAWLTAHPAYSFVIGLFFGVLLIDVVSSIQLVAKLKAFAEENHVIVRYETIKTNLRSYCEATAQKYRFSRPFHTDRPLNEHLKDLREHFEQKRRKKK